jgi:hypothetical protein
LRELEERAIDLPLIGKFHTPDKHDVVYVAGLAALLVVGAVELPIALIVLGGHVLVKQHSSRSLSAVGEVSPTGRRLFVRLTGRFSGTLAAGEMGS